MKAKSKKRLHALLLTDMLLLLLPPSMSAKEGDGNSYELYRDPILLDTLHVMECEPARVPLLGNPRLCMEVTTGMDKALVVALSSPQERTEWIAELRSAVSDYHKKRVVMTEIIEKDHESGGNIGSANHQGGREKSSTWPSSLKDVCPKLDP